MSIHTNIGYADSSVNVSSGCDGCELWTGTRRQCYAGILHETRLAKALPRLYAPSFSEVRLLPGRMAQAAHWSDLRGKNRPDKPWLNGKPRHIFISDLSDALSEAVPFDYLEDEIIYTVRTDAGSRHIWLWLTKQSKRMAEFAEWLKGVGQNWPDNLYAGTSVTNQATADLRIPWLLKLRTIAKTLFVSYEPALGRLELIGHPGFYIDGSCAPMGTAGYESGIHWVIIGGESGPGFRQMPVGWVSSVAEHCRRAGVKCFVKQAEGPRPGQQGGIPDDLWALKEMPEISTPRPESTLRKTAAEDDHGG